MGGMMQMVMNLWIGLYFLQCFGDGFRFTAVEHNTDHCIIGKGFKLEKVKTTQVWNECTLRGRIVINKLALNSFLV